MESHASVYQFEEANEVKSKIKHLQKFQYKSTVVDTNITSLGVMNFTKDSKYAYINALLVMQGTIIKSKTTVVQTTMGENDERILSHALGNNLTEIFNDIKELVLPIPIPIEATFKIHIPQRGDKRNLLLLSKKMQLQKNELLKAEHLKDPDAKKNYILNQLKSDLRLNEIPLHMECFDNSIFKGVILLPHVWF